MQLQLYLRDLVDHSLLPLSQLDVIDLTLKYNRLLAILFLVKPDLILKDENLLAGEVIYDFIIGLALHLIAW